MGFTLHHLFYDNLYTALKDHRPYEVVVRSAGTQKREEIPEYRIHFLDRNWSWGAQKQTEDSHKMVVAAILAERFSQGDVAPEETKKLFEVSRKILPSLRKLEDQGAYNAVRPHFLAMRYDLPIQVFLDYPDFGDFLENNHLHHFLRHYQDEVTLRPESFEPQMLYKGEWRSWEGLRDSMPMDESFRLTDHRYSYCGFEEGTYDKWTDFVPYDWRDPKEWDYKYVFEVCCNCTNTPENLTGDHSWFRLYTPDGWIFSVGLYRDGKNSEDTVWMGCDMPRDHLNNSASIKPAYLYSPDISEFHPAPFYTWKVEITKEQFQDIKKAVELDKQEGIYFHMLRLNCTQYTKNKALMAGLEIPTELPAARVLFSQVPGALSVADAVSPYITNLGRRVSELALTVLINGIQYRLGGAELHPRTVVKDHTPEPILKGLADWFKRENVQMHHPWVMGFLVRKMIEDYREEVGDRWAIPPEMRANQKAPIMPLRARL